MLKMQHKFKLERITHKIKRKMLTFNYFMSYLGSMISQDKLFLSLKKKRKFAIFVKWDVRLKRPMQQYN